MSRPDVVNDFEAWATVSAKLIGKTDEEGRELLARMDLTLVWKNANDAWAKALAGDIVDMRLHRAQRYAEICANVLSGLDDLSTDSLSLSLSDELSRQTTHRMQAHPPTAPVRTFVDAITPTHVVSRPQRKQALTHAAPRQFELPGVEETLTLEDEDSDETSILELSGSGDGAWPLEQYARYIAEHDAGHENAQAIDERYGLTPSGRQLMMSEWEERISGDSSLKEQFEKLLAQHVSALWTQRR
jgi:hypothetical protein